MRRIRIISLAILSFTMALLSPYVSRCLSFLLCFVFSANATLCNVNLISDSFTFSDHASAYGPAESVVGSAVGVNPAQSLVAQASYCNSGSVISSGIRSGFDGRNYFISYDFTRGIEQVNTAACGREYQTQPDPNQPHYGSKFVYLVDGFKNRVSPILYLELVDGSLKVFEQNSPSSVNNNGNTLTSPITNPITSLDDGTSIKDTPNSGSSSASSSSASPTTSDSSTSSSSSSVSSNDTDSSTTTFSSEPSIATTEISPQPENIETSAVVSNAKINFQPSSSSVPSGYTKDTGSAYDNGRGFGWVRQDSLGSTRVPLDISANTRDRNRSGIDQRLDTVVHMQFPSSSSSTSAVKTPAAWEIAVPNDIYLVTVSVGDQSPYDSNHKINVEGVTAINLFQGSSGQEYKQATVRVAVADGKLTIDAIGGTNTKLNYVEISPSTRDIPAISVQNLDTVPFADRLVFNRIGSLSNPPSNGVHNIAKLRIKNTGTAALQITGLPITGAWKLASSISLPRDIAAGSQLDVSVQFTAAGGDFNNGKLTIQSNDPNRPNLDIQLAGFWQSVSEGGQEPNLVEAVNLFGYKTVILKSGEFLNHNGEVQKVGDEVLSPYWQIANGSKPITVKQLAAYHKQGTTATVSWYKKGSSTNTLLVHDSNDGQSVLPNKSGSTTELAQGSFSPSATVVFGFKIDSEWSDPTLNDQTPDIEKGCQQPCGHHVRFWPAKDRQGLTIPNTWLMGMDYLGINYDYQDNIYLVSNMIPAPIEALYRIDVAGSSSYTDTSGNRWSVDTGFFSPSSAIAQNGGDPPPAIANTVDDKLYQTHRGNIGNSTPQSERIISFNFPISTSGRVNLRLHFAELFWGAPGRGAPGPGKRIFDVIAEGRQVLSNFDITAATGGALIATVVPIRGVNVTDGTLNLQFKADVDFPSIAAIEVLK